MKYEFILMYLGDEIERRSYEKYESARRFFYNEYFNLDRGCRVFIDGEEMNIFKAYDYFNLSPLVLNYIWSKTSSYEDFL